MKRGTLPFSFAFGWGSMVKGHMEERKDLRG